MLAAAYSKYRWYRLWCLPFIWHFFFIVTHTHTPCSSTHTCFSFTGVKLCHDDQSIQKTLDLGCVVFFVHVFSYVPVKAWLGRVFLFTTVLTKTCRTNSLQMSGGSVVEPHPCKLKAPTKTLLVGISVPVVASNTVIAEIFVCIKISHSCVRKLSYAIVLYSEGDVRYTGMCAWLSHATKISYLQPKVQNIRN